MPWTQAEPVVDPPDDRDHRLVEVVDEAFTTPFVRGDLKTTRGPSLWLRGAVHRSDGSLVVHSQRDWNGDRMSPVAADPSRVEMPTKARRLKGRWIYAGHWDGHFGHLLVDVLPTLWPDPAEVGPITGVLAHRSPMGDDEPPGARRKLVSPELTRWRRRLLDLTGYEGVLHVQHGRALRIEQLVVPARPVLHKKWLAPPALDLWRRMAAGVQLRSPHRAVYLSRSAFNADPVNQARVRSDPATDAALDRRFAAAGFHVARPERLSIDEQIALVRDADVLAGQSGSSLHLSVFSPPSTRVLVIGDQRLPHRVPWAQRVVDAGLGHRTAFVPSGDDATLDELLADLDR